MPRLVAAGVTFFRPDFNKLFFMITFNQETRQNIYEKYWHKCANSADEKCLINKGLSIHHLIHNTKPNQKKYGDRLQSEANGLLLCQHCHTNQACFTWIQEQALALKTEWDNEIESNL